MTHDYEHDPVCIIARNYYDSHREEYPGTPALGDHELMLALENSNVAWEKDYMFLVSRIEDALSDLIDWKSGNE